MTQPPRPETMGLSAVPDLGASMPVLPQRQKVILVMDLVESVRLMAANELAVIDHWRGFVQHAAGIVLPRHSGRLVKSLGDGIMAEFDSSREAVATALELQSYFDEANASLGPEEKLYLRAGLNATHVYVDDLDIYGSGVNMAARIAGLAGPGETMITTEVREGLADGLDAHVEDMGECYLKHVAGSVRVARVGRAGPRPTLFSEHDYVPLQPTIAVIPFEPRSREEERLAIGELIAEGLIAHLSRTPGLRVIARLSATALRGRSMSLGEIGVHTGATYVVSGSYIQMGNKLRTSVELGAVRDGIVIWSQQTTSDLEDLLLPESSLCLQIAAAVAHEVVQAEARKVSYRPLPNLECSTLLIGAIALMHRRSPAAIDQAQKTLHFLNERMPKQPLGHAWLAKSFVMIAGQGGQDIDADLTGRALASANKALSLDPENSLALTIHGVVSANLRGDFAEAQHHYDEALQADPNNAMAWLYSAALAAFKGEGEKSWAMAEQALALSPMDPQKYIYQGIAAAAALANNDFPRAVDLAAHSIRLNHAHMSAWRVKVIALMLAGRELDGRHAASELLRLAPQFTVDQFVRRNQSACAQLRSRYAEALHEAGVPLT